MLNASNNKNTEFFCPNCMTKHKEINKEEHIKNLIKNFNLLRIVEKLESRKTESNPEKSMSGTNLNFLKEEMNMKQNVKQNTMDTSININNLCEQMCKKHNMPIHSYAIGTNLLFCDNCIKETNLKTYPLPNVKFILF
jgi:hypothetical protein